MSRTALLFSALALLTALLDAAPIESRGRRYRFNLDDCDSNIVLTIVPESNTIRLQWPRLPGVAYWVVLRGRTSGLENIEIAAETVDTSWTEEASILAAMPRAFYRVAAIWPGGSPYDVDVIEDFEDPVFLSSYSPEEDQEPQSWQWANDGVEGPYGWTLELLGNTWKRQTISRHNVHAETVWRIAAKSFARGETQAFGVADSANELWYPLWGRELRNSEAWVTLYQGWGESAEWAVLDLPIGSDWQGRFGYVPTITSLLYANDNDTTASRGTWRIDDIRDVTGSVTVPPLARFRWEIRGYPHPDTMEVAFCSMGCDPDGSLFSHFWTLGDATRSFLQSPIHRYPARGRYPVSLTVQDSAGRVGWVVGAVSDTTSLSSGEISALFVGDVMIARRYEDPGGIIETRGVNAIFESSRSLTSVVDLAMCNLESPLTNATEHHPTKSYYFKGRPEYVGGLVHAGFDFCALGNNHNFDYLAEGMHDTKHVLDSVAILSTGAGDNDEIASLPVFYGKNGVSVAILSFCNRDGTADNEQPFLAAGPSRPGFALWDRTYIERMIPAVRPAADIVIVQVHSGIEYSTLPPSLVAQGFDPWDPDVMTFELLPDTSDRELRRLAIDLGADLVVNHHPHVIQGCEIYNGKLIAHSMGNFAFDQTLPETMVSMAVQSRISVADGVTDFIVHPIYVDRYIPTPARGELAGFILDYIAELSRVNRTWVLREPDAETGVILVDTMLTPESGDWLDTLRLTTRDSVAASPPYWLRGEGYPVQIGVSGPPGTEFRLGRELLYFGNMENEGATPWDLNSQYEIYDPSVAFRGLRSIRLSRAGGGTNSVSTTLLYRMPFDRNRQYSVTGWVRGNNTRDARLYVEYWDRRTGGDVLAIQTVEAVLQGTFDWRELWQNLTPPDESYFWNLRLYLRSPVLGEGRAWFDDVRFVRWEDWRTTAATVGFPNDVKYIQVRAPEGTPQVNVSYHREWVSPIPLASPVAGAD